MQSEASPSPSSSFRASRGDSPSPVPKRQRHAIVTQSTRQVSDQLSALLRSRKAPYTPPSKRRTVMSGFPLMPGQSPRAVMPPPPGGNSQSESSSSAQDLDVLMSPPAAAPPSLGPSNPHEPRHGGAIVTRTMTVSTGGDPNVLVASRKADSVAAKQKRMLGKLSAAFGNTDHALKQQRKAVVMVKSQVGEVQGQVSEVKQQIGQLRQENGMLRKEVREFISRAKSEDLTLKNHLLQLDQGTDRRINKLGDFVAKVDTTVKAQGDESRANFERLSGEMGSVIRGFQRSIGEQLKEIKEAQLSEKGASKPQSSTKADSDISDPYAGMQERIEMDPELYNPLDDKSEVRQLRPGMLEQERAAFHDSSKKVQCAAPNIPTGGPSYRKSEVCQLGNVAFVEMANPRFKQDPTAAALDLYNSGAVGYVGSGKTATLARANADRFRADDGTFVNLQELNEQRWRAACTTQSGYYKPIETATPSVEAFLAGSRFRKFEPKESWDDQFRAFAAHSTPPIILAPGDTKVSASMKALKKRCSDPKKVAPKVSDTANAHLLRQIGQYRSIQGSQNMQGIFMSAFRSGQPITEDSVALFLEAQRRNLQGQQMVNLSDHAESEVKRAHQWKRPGTQYNEYLEQEREMAPHLFPKLSYTSTATGNSGKKSGGKKSKGGKKGGQRDGGNGRFDRDESADGKGNQGNGRGKRGNGGKQRFDKRDVRYGGGNRGNRGGNGKGYPL